jgi:hypothetical protein
MCSRLTVYFYTIRVCSLEVLYIGRNAYAVSVHVTEGCFGSGSGTKFTCANPVEGPAVIVPLCLVERLGCRTRWHNRQNGSHRPARPRL